MCTGELWLTCVNFGGWSLRDSGICVTLGQGPCGSCCLGVSVSRSQLLAVELKVLLVTLYSKILEAPHMQLPAQH